MHRLTVVDTLDPPPATSGANLRVAFATQDLHTLDAHFAGARNFAIYDVSNRGHRFVSAVRFESASEQDGRHDGQHDGEGEDRLALRLQAIEGCALLFVLAIGGPAAARVVNARVHPIKVAAPEPITDVLERVRTMLDGTPPPWLRRALGQGRARPSFLEVEDEA